MRIILPEEERSVVMLLEKELIRRKSTERRLPTSPSPTGRGRIDEE